MRNELLKINCKLQKPSKNGISHHYGRLVRQHNNLCIHLKLLMLNRITDNKIKCQSYTSVKSLPLDVKDKFEITP